jgi:hypothetical protein
VTHVSSSTPSPSITWDELFDRAQRTLDHRSRSFVGDAQDFARWILSDGVKVKNGLVSVSEHCNRLAEELAQLSTENRRLRAELEEWKSKHGWEIAHPAAPKDLVDENLRLRAELEECKARHAALAMSDEPMPPTGR